MADDKRRSFPLAPSQDVGESPFEDVPPAPEPDLKPRRLSDLVDSTPDPEPAPAAAPEPVDETPSVAFEEVEDDLWSDDEALSSLPELATPVPEPAPTPEPAPEPVAPVAPPAEAEARTPVFEEWVQPAESAPVAAPAAMERPAIPAEEPVAPVEPPAASAALATPVSLPELQPRRDVQHPTRAQLGMLLDVGVEVSAVVGQRQLTLDELLHLEMGSVVELERSAGEPIELQIGGRTIALAEIVAVEGRLGARILKTFGSPES